MRTAPMTSFKAVHFAKFSTVILNLQFWKSPFNEVGEWCRPRQSWLRTVEADLRPRTGDVEAACSGQIGMAETRDNGYVYDKLLKKEKKKKND